MYATEHVGNWGNCLLSADTGQTGTCDCCFSVSVQLSDLNRKLLDKEQVLQEYEYERSQMQRRMEELSQRLMDKSTSLDGSRSVSFCVGNRTGINSKVPHQWAGSWLSLGLLEHLR